MHSLREKLRQYNLLRPGEDMFNLWRAVFALSHVDGAVASEEAGFILKAMEVFEFSEIQHASVHSDMSAPGDVIRLFEEIKTPALRGLFFRLARILIWCDGILHETEMAKIDEIKARLGDNAARYEADLRWIGRNPEMPFGESAQSREEKMVKMMMYQVIEFAKGEVERGNA